MAEFIYRRCVIKEKACFQDDVNQSANKYLCLDACLQGKGASLTNVTAACTNINSEVT